MLWDFLLETTHRGVGLIPANSMKRVPDGVASLTYSRPPHVPAQYVELSKYGPLYAARNFSLFREGDGPEQLHFSGLFQILLRLTAAADRFYNTCGYRGNALVRASVHEALGRHMRFIPANPYGFGPGLGDFQCFTDSVTAERLLSVDELRSRRVDVLTEVLSEIAWAFWQSNQNFPAAQLRDQVQGLI